MIFHENRLLADDSHEISFSLALESQTSINKLKAPSAYQRSSKCMKTSKKINFIKIVFVSISINGDSIYTYRNEHYLYKIDFFMFSCILSFVDMPWCFHLIN